jgi:hypothetical protein
MKVMATKMAALRLWVRKMAADRSEVAATKLGNENLSFSRNR